MEEPLRNIIREELQSYIAAVGPYKHPVPATVYGSIGDTERQYQLDGVYQHITSNCIQNIYCRNFAWGFGSCRASYNIQQECNCDSVL